VLTSGLPHDPRWQADRFHLQPVDAVLKAYGWALKEKAKRTNELSTTTARLAVLVEMAGFPGLGSKGRTEEQFLPFDIRDADSQRAQRLTPEVAATIRSLLRDGQLPLRVLVLAVEELERSKL